MKPLIIFGISSFAEIAKLYFERDTDFEPVAFAVDEQWRTIDHFQGLPVVSMESMPEHFKSTTHHFHVAATYTEGNRLRRRKVDQFQRLGFAAASYISPHSYVDPSVSLGEHLFIFEDNTIQPFVHIANDVILWSGNHVGHHSVISEDVFVSSHVVISGHCHIGPRTFLGVNCSIGNNVNIGADNWILPGTVLLQDTEGNQMWRPERSVLSTRRPVSDG